MFLSLHSLVHTAEQVGLVAGIILGVGIISKAVWEAWKFIRKFVKAVEFLEDIYREFRPDSGYSIKDTVDRIDHNVHVNARNIEALYALTSKTNNIDPIEIPLLEVLRPEPEPRQG